MRRGFGHDDHVASRQGSHPLQSSQGLLGGEDAALNPPPICITAVRPKQSCSPPERSIQSIRARELTFVTSGKECKPTITISNVVSDTCITFEANGEAYGEQ